MARLDFLDDEDRVVSSALWRNVCGQPSNNSWQKYRHSVGINPQNRKHKLTRREAYLLLVRSNLRTICGQLGVPKPKDSEIEEYLPNSPLFDVAEMYASKFPGSELANYLNKAIASSSLSGEAILELLQTMSEVAQGKMGERKIQLAIAQAGLGSIKKKTIYPYAQISRFINAVSTAFSPLQPQHH